MIPTKTWPWAMFAIFAALGLLLRAPSAAAEPGGDYLSLGVGVFDVTDLRDDSLQGRIEYAHGFRVLGVGPYFKGIGPLAGLMVNTDGGVFGYGGIFGDVELGEHVVIRPQLGLGGYGRGESSNLGGVFQFHLGADVSYRFDNGHRIGVMFTHMSSAGINDPNPGADSALLTYGIPLGSLF